MANEEATKKILSRLHMMGDEYALRISRQAIEEIMRGENVFIELLATFMDGMYCYRALLVEAGVNVEPLEDKVMQKILNISNN